MESKAFEEEEIHKTIILGENVGKLAVFEVDKNSGSCIFCATYTGCNELCQSLIYFFCHISCWH